MSILKSLRNTLICAALILGALVLSEPYKICLLLGAIMIGSYKQTFEGILDSYENRRINVELLMILSAIGAVYIGEALEGATLILIFSLSGELESLTRDKSQKEIRKLMTHQPQIARRVLADGKSIEVSLSSLNKGEVVSVLKGETISADGVIVMGASDIDESMITGESMPCFKKMHEKVFTGTLNLSAPIHVEVLETSDNAMIQKIIKMVENSEKQASKTGKLIDRIEGVYALSILGIVFLSFIVFKFFLNWSLDQALYRSIILLVVASPCALIASVTPATLAGIANMAKKGVLIKGGSHLELLGHIDAIAFDKTGTLTLGKPRVVGEYFVEPLQHITASLESHSTHPLAIAITQHYIMQEANISFSDIKDINGVGLSGINEGNTFKVGKYEPGNYDATILNTYEVYKNEGLSIVAIYKNHMCLGLVGLEDTIREESVEFINDLKTLNITPIMLTGDQELSAVKVGKALGIQKIVANCYPEDKVAVIEKLNKEFHNVMMVGDGINDAPALAKATLGISIGSGSDIAIETSDIVLMNSNLNNIISALKASQKLSKIITQNIVFSLSVIVILIILNLAGVINLPMGVLGHEGSTILVILNGLRMLKSK